jgi:hypothetical protein
MTGTDHRAVRILRVLFPIAVAVSIVHYTDNYFNYSDFPQSRSLPNPSQALVGSAWFAFTAIGLVGFLLLRRRVSTLALALLALYSGSGLVGIGHFLVPGATSMPWWRQTHVVLDIACGVGIFAATMWAARERLFSAARPV